MGEIPWRREWQPTPVFLPDEFDGQEESGENHCLVNIRDSPDVHVFQPLGIAHGSRSGSFTSNPRQQLLNDMAHGSAQVSEVGAVRFQAKTPPAAHLFHSDNRESTSPVHLTENH